MKTKYGLKQFWWDFVHYVVALGIPAVFWVPVMAIWTKTLQGPLAPLVPVATFFSVIPPFWVGDKIIHWTYRKARLED